MEEERRQRFEFLDGLRALAALGVAVLHGFLFTGHLGQAQETFPVLGRFVLNGRFAVAVFIVLSGFVLGLPVMGRPGLRFSGGLRRFFTRRARRILPPYYFAFLVYLLLILAIPYLHDAQDTQWRGKVPVTWTGVVSHLLLLHNAHAGWAFQVDGPLWSVATEAQIYVLMPLLLLPLWRRLGALPTVLAAVLGGVAIHVVAPVLDTAHYWYVGLFAAGMWAAEAAVHRRRLPGAQVLAPVLAVLVLLALVLGQYRLQPHDWLTEPIVGLVFALCLHVLASARPGEPAHRLVRLLEWPPLVRVGLFSYSIYLFHSPVIGIGNLALIHVAMPLWVRLTLCWAVFLPLSVALSHLAYLLVERRFLTGHQRAEQAREPLPRTVPATR